MAREILIFCLQKASGGRDPFRREMAVLKFAAVLMVGLSLANSALGLAQFGEAKICAGELLVVRERKRWVFRLPQTPVKIFENDILRVGQSSLVILRAGDRSLLMRLGSNAVVEVRPWRKKEKQGMIRILYGRAEVAILARDRRVYMRTVSAIFWGVFATYSVVVNPDGTTSLQARDNKPDESLGSC